MTSKHSLIRLATRCRRPRQEEGDKAVDMQFTWTGYYTELADRLLSYRNDRQALISKLRETYVQIGMKFPKLDSTDVPADIDPFTVFGLFNRGLSDANRKKIAAGFAHSLGIKADQPADFDGIPVVMALNATFFCIHRRQATR